MAIHKVQMDDGTIVRVEAEENANPEDVMAFASQQYADQQKPQFTQMGESAADDDPFGISTAGMEMPTEAGRKQAIRHFAQGASFRLSDEIEALLSGQDANKIRQEMAQYAQERPGVATTAELVGSLYNPAILAKTPISVGMLSPTAQATVKGAAYGAGYGAGGAEGGLSERLAGGAYGGLAGGFFGLGSQGLLSLGTAATNKLQSAIFKKAAEKPVLQTLRDADREAYKLLDDSGLVVGVNEIKNVYTAASNRARQVGYSPMTDSNALAAQRELQDLVAGTSPGGGKAPKVITLSELEKIRSKWHKRASRISDGNDRAATRAIANGIDDAIDDLLQRAPGVDPRLARSAREAHKQYMKAKTFDEAFAKADLKGGNTLQAYRNAVMKVYNNENLRRFYSQEELKAMETFIKGGFAQNLMAKFARLSPSSSGLMQMLQVGGMLHNPKMAGLSAAAILGEQASSSSARKQAKDLIDLFGGRVGKEPQQVPAATVGTYATQK